LIDLSCRRTLNEAFMVMVGTGSQFKLWKYNTSGLCSFCFPDLTNYSIANLCCLASPWDFSGSTVRDYVGISNAYVHHNDRLFISGFDGSDPVLLVNQLEAPYSVIKATGFPSPSYDLPLVTLNDQTNSVVWAVRPNGMQIWFVLL